VVRFARQSFLNTTIGSIAPAPSRGLALVLNRMTSRSAPVNAGERQDGDDGDAPHAQERPHGVPQIAGTRVHRMR
jgi:hypothetical protein